MKKHLGGRRRKHHHKRGRGILDGPMITHHALFGKRPDNMPKYGVGKRRHRRRGRGILSDINEWLKKTKILSTVGKAVAPLTGSFAPLVSGATQFAESHGYGRKHKRGGCDGAGKRRHKRRGGDDIIKSYKCPTKLGGKLRGFQARYGGNNPFPYTNSFYGKPVF